MSFLPRPVPSPHPNISQDSMRPCVPDVSVMDNECETDDYIEPLLDLFEKILENKVEIEDDDSQSSIELPRREEASERYHFDDTRRLMNTKRNDRFVRKKPMTSPGGMEMSRCSDKIDNLDISVNYDSVSSLQSLIYSRDLRFTSTPSYHVPSFKMDPFSQFSPFSPIAEEAAIVEINSPRPGGAVKINYSDSVKISQKQNYHRNDVSIQMLKLREKYLRKHNTTREENQRLNNVSDHLEYSLASAKYLHKHELLPKKYKIKENDKKTERSRAEYSIATQQYMEKHGLLNKNTKQPQNDPKNDQNRDDSFDILPKHLHGKKLN